MSDLIKINKLTKNFYVFDKKPGLAESVKSLFHRKYRCVKAVDQISFSIKQGELLGFIGPNGAGKSTTLKCLTGLLFPTQGSVEVLGYTPSRRQPEYLRSIGFVMGQKNQLWWDLPPQETFLLNQAIYDIPVRQYQRQLDFFVEALDIKDIINVQTKKLSLGQRMKCEFVVALLHQPKVVFLDEPTIGLDILAGARIRQFIEEYNREFKSTIILTSHNMTDVEQLCHRIIIIDNGKIKYDGETGQLKSKYRHHKLLKLTFNNPVAVSNFVSYGQAKSTSPYSLEISLPQENYLPSLSEIINRFQPTDLTVEDTPIETIIKQIFKGR